MTYNDNIEWTMMDCVVCNGHGTIKTNPKGQETKDFVTKDCPVCDGLGGTLIMAGEYDTCLVAQGHMTGNCLCGGSKENQDKEIEKRLTAEEKIGL
jgi:hypothetical protein